MDNIVKQFLGQEKSYVSGQNPPISGPLKNILAVLKAESRFEKRMFWAIYLVSLLVAETPSSNVFLLLQVNRILFMSNKICAVQTLSTTFI